MNPEDIIQRMQNAINQQNNQAGAGQANINRNEAPMEPEEVLSTEASLPVAENAVALPLEIAEPIPVATQPLPGTLFQPINDEDWWATLPELTHDEFLIEIEEDPYRVIFCVKELEWHIAVDIEAQSFRINNRDESYFSGEYERREILSRAIIWVADVKSQQVVYNKFGNILKRIHQEPVEALWEKYYRYTTLGADEANALYTAALKYFGRKTQDGYPTPSLIIKVDMMRKLGAMSYAEMLALKATEMERIQLILMARSEALNTNESGHYTPVSHTNLAQPEHQNLPPELFPPEVRAHIFGNK